MYLQAGLNESTIRKYIADQEKRDMALDKLSVKEYEGPFKGGKSGRGNRLKAHVRTTRQTGGYDLLNAGFNLFPPALKFPLGTPPGRWY